MIHQNGATRHPVSTPIYVRGRSRPIGYVAGGVFYKNLRTNHFLKRPPAICFERYHLDQIEAAGGTSCRFTHTETGDVYTCSMATVRRYAFPVNRRYGSQVGVELSHWAVNGQESAAAWESNQQISDAQMGLFEEV